MDIHSKNSYKLFIFAFLILLIVTFSCEAKFEDIGGQDFQSKSNLYFIYASGKSDLMGSSIDFHITPFWFQTSESWLSYGFNGGSVILINGEPTFHDEPVRVYLEGFKGFSPGSIHWKTKSIIGSRIRLLGICSYIEIN